MEDELKRRVLFIFDEIPSDTDNSLVKSYLNKLNWKYKIVNPEIKYFIIDNSPEAILNNTINLSDMATEIQFSNIIFFDYGGMTCRCKSQRIDFFERFFVKCIEENPSKMWISISHMPIFLYHKIELKFIHELNIYDDSTF